MDRCKGFTRQLLGCCFGDPCCHYHIARQLQGCSESSVGHFSVVSGLSHYQQVHQVSVKYCKLMFGSINGLIGGSVVKG